MMGILLYYYQLLLLLLLLLYIIIILYQLWEFNYGNFKSIQTVT
jgi:hypothetical protein